ncbi:hypothetical protein ACQKNQ_12245 [Staphylococcus pasteuri]|uniref:hypothetical protein n=1 Tax=Staphylococcus pasteuri TaxID=45972 RepID=UPI003D043C77
MKSNYNVRKAKKSDYVDIKNFFNKYNKYQIGNQKLEVEDIELSFEVKEIEAMFLLYYKKKLVGTSGNFNFVYQGISLPNSIYSGFLLIDSNHRNGPAITTLNKALYQIDEKTKTHLSEVAINNKRSLKLNKLNGYTDFFDSEESISHHKLLISKLALIANTFNASNELKKIFDISKLRFKNANFDKLLGYTAYLKIGNKNLKVVIQNSKPWYIDIELISIKIIKNRNYITIELIQKDTLFTNVQILNESSEHIASKKMNSTKTLLKIKPEFNTMSIKILHKTKGILELSMESFILDKERNMNKKIYLSKNNFFDCFVFNKLNGDITLYKDDKELLIEKNLRVKFNEKPQINIIILNDNKFKITTKTSNNIISKVIQFTSNGYYITYDFIDSNISNIIKCGVEIFHGNYYLEHNNKFERFNLGIIPPENEDFVKAKNFKSNKKIYLLEDGKYLMQVNSDHPSSNQMLYRPLFLVRNNNKLTYNVQMKKNATINNKVNFMNKKFIPIQIENIRAFNITGHGYFTTKESIDSKIEKHKYHQNNKIILFINGTNNVLISFNLISYGRIYLYEDNQYTELKNMDFWRERYEKITLYSEKNDGYISLYIRNAYINFYKNKNKIFFKLYLKEYRNNKIEIYNDGGITYEKH